jgi:hypothetical protein
MGFQKFRKVPALKTTLYIICLGKGKKKNFSGFPSSKDQETQMLKSNLYLQQLVLNIWIHIHF